MKKILAIVLATMLLCTCIPMGVVSVSAATSGKTGDCTWTLDGTHLTISGKGAMGDYLFDTPPWGNVVTKVTIGAGVTSLGEYAFSDSKKLTSISVSKDNPYFSSANGVLFNKKKTKLILCPPKKSGAYTIPDSVTTIDESAFSGCEKLTSLTIGKGITALDGFMFTSCTGLTSLTIGKSVATINHNAFSSCKKLTTLTVSKNNPYFTVADGVLFNKKKTKIITCLPGKSGTYTIPDSVTTIGEYAFSGRTKLTKVNFGKKLKTIDACAFLWCNNLTTLTIPDSVTTIGEGAFASCENLKSITIGKGLKEIYNMPAVSDLTPHFFGCNKLATISISKENPYLSSANGVVFNKAKTKLLLCPPGKTGAYTVPNTVTTIEQYAFWGCNNLTAITVSDSVKTIKTAALNHCENLKKVSLGKNVKTIEKGYYGWHYESVFGENPKFTTLTVSKNNPYYTVENGVLFNKKKTQIVLCLPGKTGYYIIPDGVTTVKECAFASCMKLNAVVIPTSVKTLEECAFGWDIEDIYYRGTKTQAGKIDDYSSYAMHYNTCKTHKYTNACDKSCNKCDWTRTISHTYKVVATKKATATANGYIQKKCSVCGATTKTTLYKASKISLSATAYTYDGKVKKPTITVKDSKGNKIATSNYTVTYASGRKNVGTYKVTVKFKGNYSGTKTLTFKINPAKTSLSSLTAGAKKLTVKWAKKTTQVTGYQIQYSTSKSFSSYKSKTITKNSTVSTALTGLSAKKTYYVRVRTYKTVNGVKIYSGWSTAKSLKTK